jgi:hypothetical protein
MAKENKAPVVNFEAPEGFQRSGSASAVGWFNPLKAGNTLRGTLIGMFKKPDMFAQGKQVDFFQVQVSQACEVRADRGEESHMLEAKPGDVVNINYGPKTKNWELLTGDIKRGAVYEVLATVIGDKVKLAGNRKMHNVDVFQKCVRAPQSNAEVDVDFGGSADDTEQGTEV